MSIFNEILAKIDEISSGYKENIQNELQSALAALDKFGEDYLKTKGRETILKGRNATVILQSINEDEDEAAKPKDTATKRRSSKTKTSEEAKLTNNTGKHANDTENLSEPAAAKRRSKKRSKEEVDGISSPAQDKRLKRNASVKASGIISKQVNVNLSSKLRRDDSAVGKDDSRGQRARKDDDSDKENSEPLIKVKQEKLSLPPEEPMDCESLPLNVEVKQEPSKDEVSMPPPAVPVPKPRGRPAKERQQKEKELDKEKERERADESSEEESGGRRRRTALKQTDSMPPPPAPSSRSTRASSRASSRNNTTQQEEMPPPDARPKRTRAKKKTDSESSQTENDKTDPQENGVVSPSEKSRPKRTRRGKAAQKDQVEETQKPEVKKDIETVISPKEERISNPAVTTNASSPILQKELKVDLGHKEPKSKSKKEAAEITVEQSEVKTVNLEETRVISANDMNATINICNGDIDKTVVLPNGKYNHSNGDSKKVRTMNETVVLDSNSRDTFVVANPPTNAINDVTVVIEKEAKASNVTDDNSLMTDDNSDNETHTPPRPPPAQPTSAVKEKVQQFEEMASRVTRTKTRAMAKKEDDVPENHTPPDKIGKPVLSADTLSKMNSLIFNGKAPPQISSSAHKPRANIPVPTKHNVPSSASKVSGLAKAKEAAEESARKKKEAILEAKKESQRRKREEKMAAAAAARSAAERERQLAIQAAARERLERQAHADVGKLERAKEQERKKLELQRKAAVTEERRLADERARQQRLAEDQRRAEEQRRKLQEEQEAMKKEAAMMAKEIEKRQKEYLEKQKLKQKMEADKVTTPLKLGSLSATRIMDPVHMADGFEQLNSDADDDDETTKKKFPVPDWSTSKVRWQQLVLQSYIKQSHIDRLFSVRVHSPDLQDIFPNIERRLMKRTSSAVWRTPPHRLHTLQE